MVHSIPNIFATEYYKQFPPHLNSDSTLPCKTQDTILVENLNTVSQ